jgi:hypothetical protein
MADNVAVTPGVGATLAADEIVGVLYPRAKMTWGTDGVANDTDVASGKPLPVQLRSPSGVDMIGIAGSPSLGVLTVQGAGAGTAIPVNIGTSGTVSITSSQLSLLGQNTAANSTPVVLASNPLSATANGLTSSRVVVTAANTVPTSLKATAGNLARMDLFNVATYDVFFKLYNKASAPTVGTDTPVWTIPLKAATGFSTTFLSGKSFSTGIAYAITKLQPDTDTTVLVIGDVTGSIDWI